MQNNWGFDNPQQVPEIRSRTLQTNLDRYGYEYPASSPEIQEKIRITCEERYGGPAPICDPEVRSKMIETNLQRYGAPFTSAVPAFRAQQLQTMINNYGSHFFASKEGRQAVKDGMMCSLGVEHALQDPEIMATVLGKRVQTWLDKYGVSHHLHVPEILAKMLRNRTFECPNRFEQRLMGMLDTHPILSNRVTFTGDGKVLVSWTNQGSRRKNPDFVIVPEGFDGDFSDFQPTKVIEANGMYWHGPAITGISREEHEKDMIANYAAEGIQCLVIWEGEILKDPEGVLARILDLYRT